MSEWVGSTEYEQLKRWALAQPALAGGGANHWQDLDGDAGFRKYARISGSESLIACYSPKATEDLPQFIAVSKLFCGAEVAVPKVLAVDLDAGFSLLEDAGQFDLYQAPQESKRALYEKTLCQLAKIATIETTALPAYSRDFLHQELHLFNEWLLDKTLGLVRTPAQKKMLKGAFDWLVKALVAQPQVVVHRDFHSQNILINQQENPVIIDFQGALVGPIGYDLASLLKDCYLDIPDSDVAHYLSFYQKQLPGGESLDMARYMHLAGLQRHLKVLGIFRRLAMRDGKLKYLASYPRVMRYVAKTLIEFDETGDMADLVYWFHETLIPEVMMQDWYQGALE